jgi:eukaryotic-like serine/threonine-protein kinase
MALRAGPAQVVRFSVFELDLRSGELRKSGVRIPLQDQPLEILTAVLEQPGQLITREELRRRLWPDDTLVDFDDGLNAAVRRLREALGDNATTPRFIETLPRRGYRFIAPVAAPALPVALGDTAQPQGMPAAQETATTTSESRAIQSKHWLGGSARWLAAVIALGALVSGVAAVVLLTEPRRVAPPQSRARFDVAMPEHITFTSYDFPVISPDGRRVAFTGLSEGRRQLWVRPLDATTPPTPIPLPGTDGAMSPFWSPDSRSLAFFADRKLRRIEADGTSLITLCDAPSPVGVRSRGAWGSGGVILFTKGPVHRVAETGGEPEPVTRLDASRRERWNLVHGFLSDGNRFVFSDPSTPPTYYVTSLSAPSERRRLSIGTGASPVRGLSISRGNLIYARQGAVVVQPFDEKTLEPRGTAITLAEVDRGALWQPHASASQTAVLVFGSGGNPMSELTWRDRDGDPRGVIGSPELFTQLELSPNGTRAVVVRGGPWPEDWALWVVDLASGILSKLTSGPFFESSPAWSPDGRRIAYHSSRDGTVSPFIKHLDTGKEERLLESPERLALDDWTPDGHFLVLRSFGVKVFALPLVGERKLRLLADTPYTEDQMQVSPDGRWIAFNSDESDAWEVYVARFPEFTDKRQVSVAGGVQPRWRRDGRELFYVAPDSTMMALTVAAGATPTFDRPRALFKTSLSPPAPEWSEFDVTSDGQRFLILEPARARPQVFTFLLNWTEGLPK